MDSILWVSWKEFCTGWREDRESPSQDSWHHAVSLPLRSLYPRGKSIMVNYRAPEDLLSSHNGVLYTMKCCTNIQYDTNRTEL